MQTSTKDIWLSHRTTTASVLGGSNVTTALREPATFPWEEANAKLTRRLVYYLLHGFVGLITTLFNGLVILVYFKRHRIRKHISLVMLSMFIFCFFHGLLVGIVYPLQRVYRYVMHPNMCVITTLLMDFADKYIVVYLPVLAVERLLFLKFPFIGKTKVKVWAICSMIFLLVFAMLYSWLPLVPSIDVPKETYIFSNNTERQKYLIRFYAHYTCHGKLNKKHKLEPVFTLIVSCLCVFVVIAAYVWMFFIARARLSAFVSMTAKKKRRLKKAAIAVMLVAMTFIITMLPYGIVIQIAAFCEADTSLRKNSFCNSITLELRFIFSILAHLGNLLAPLLFAFLSPHIRQSINLFVRSKLANNFKMRTGVHLHPGNPPYLPGSSSNEPKPRLPIMLSVVSRPLTNTSSGYMNSPSSLHRKATLSNGAIPRRTLSPSVIKNTSLSRKRTVEPEKVLSPPKTVGTIGLKQQTPPQLHPSRQHIRFKFDVD